MSETRNSEASYQPMTFDAIKIGLASPEKIREWSHGEVTKPETINYRTLKPERDGLFCEKIFGPNKDWECHCGKYKKIRYKGVVCDRCGVEVTKATVRRERMGHIELAAPVSHIWYFKGIPSRMGLILDLSPRVLEKVLYFASYIVLDAGESNLEYKQVLSEKEYQDARETWGNKFRVGMGAEAIKELLQAIDLEGEAVELKTELKDSSGQKRARIIKRLEVVEAFRGSGNKPEWMVMDTIPVIPPDLRPMVQLDGGRFATSDLNDLYRRIINRNNRLKRLLELGAPDIIVRNEKRMLQEAVDALIDNGRRGRPVTGPGNRALKSLSDMLKGKTGRFRQNLLGKRVDYSGRSVIVVGPELKIYQCGLPKEMAIELFKPFVMKELVAKGISQNIKNAKKLVERLDTQVWDVLEEVIKEHPVMLNRAPTLHRLGIQAFEPILVEGKAIKLHPLVCTAFNADFDGDQMAVHLPLSVEAQAECRFLLLSPNNLLKPSDGGPVAVPSQDMVLGIYYLTQERPGAKGEGKFFKNVNEAILAYENQVITLHSKITVRVTKETVEGEVISGNVESTLGRFLFNEILPQDLGFVERNTPEDLLKLEVDFHVGKKGLKQILDKVINTHGASKSAEVLDDVKAIGYKYSTRAAMTVSISDMTVPAKKPEMLAAAQATVDRIAANYRRGLITEEERYRAVVETWNETDKELTEVLLAGLDKYNNIFMMADSGARGSNQQIKQTQETNNEGGNGVPPTFTDSGAQDDSKPSPTTKPNTPTTSTKPTETPTNNSKEENLITSISPSATSYNLTIGETKTIGYVIAPSNSTEKIKWESENKNVVTVDNGTIKAIGIGQTFIKASTSKAGFSVSVTVTNKKITINSFDFKQSQFRLAIGESTIVPTNIIPSNATEKLVWFSSDPKVATVTDGKITAVGKGSAFISASSEKCGSISCSVEVTAPPTTEPVSDVLIISNTQTISNQTIDTDVYITSTGVATFNNVTVNGNIYCYGQLKCSGCTANNVYAYAYGSMMSCGAFDGTHGKVSGGISCNNMTILDNALDYAFNKWGKK